jgi:phosphopantothenoylcysteine decarboxylase/phosphopantothenate--cysteine ligase
MESALMMSLKNKKILLGISGGIAAYKSPELVRQLIKQGAQVQVVMTDAATHFVTPTTLQAVSGNSVFISQWDSRIPNGMPHIELTRDVDAILIAPASADFMAKLSLGLANDLLSCLSLARGHEVNGMMVDCPLLIVPAMNRQMWEHVATQRSVERLVQDQVVILGPASGDQACGEVGMGRMLEPQEICEALIAFFQPKVLLGKKVLITAGPTYEAIDPVRGLTNRSSGKMGFALARASIEAGAQVHLISGPVHLETPLAFTGQISRTSVVSAQEMQSAVMAHKDCDLFFSVAAVADWRVNVPAEQKIKKAADSDSPALNLIQNPDILFEYAQQQKGEGTFCVGFAAETENILEYGKKKIISKDIPLLIANHGPNTFGEDINQVTLIDARGAVELGPADKLSLARDIIHAVAQRLTP